MGWTGKAYSQVKWKIERQCNTDDVCEISPDNHSGDAYRMYNEKTKRIIVSGDVVWMEKMYYGKEGKPQEFKSYEEKEETGEYTHNDSDSEDEGNGNMTTQSTTKSSPNRQGSPTRATRASVNQSNIITGDRAIRSSGRTTRLGRPINEPNIFSYSKMSKTGALTGEIFGEEIAEYYNTLKVVDTFDDGEICSQAGANVVSSLFEVAGVRAGTGNELTNTSEFKQMKYKETNM